MGVTPEIYIVPLTPIEQLAEIAFLASRGPTVTSFDECWEGTARAVAAEVLKDPRQWAKDLGLPEPRYSVTVEPRACPSCGAYLGHLVGCTL